MHKAEKRATSINGRSALKTCHVWAIQIHSRIQTGPPYSSEVQGVLFWFPCLPSHTTLGPQAQNGLVLNVIINQYPLPEYRIGLVIQVTSCILIQQKVQQIRYSSGSAFLYNLKSRQRNCTTSNHLYLSNNCLLLFLYDLKSMAAQCKQSRH